MFFFLLICTWEEKSSCKELLYLLINMQVQLNLRSAKRRPEAHKCDPVLAHGPLPKAKGRLLIYLITKVAQFVLLTNPLDLMVLTNPVFLMYLTLTGRNT